MWETYVLLLKQMLEINMGMNKEPVAALCAGDRARFTIDGEDRGTYLVREILQIQQMKSANLEKLSEVEPQEAGAAPKFFTNALLGEMDRENAAAI